MQFWFWDLQNEYEVVNEGAIPMVVEKGPYTYREYREKVGITWNDNDTVSFRQVTTYKFEANMSVGLENDTILTVNIPFVTVVNMVRTLPGFLQKIVDFLAEVMDEKLFKTLTVKELLWGYEDPIFRLVYNLTGSQFIPSPYFGLFQGQNNSDDGEYTVFTGEKDTTKLNIIDRWKGETKLPYWSDEYANMINGTDATLNPPFSSPYDDHYVFVSAACRSLPGKYDDQPLSVRGISVDRFGAPSDVFANVTDNPANAGFCTPDVEHCLPSGFLDVSNCQQGAPVVLSFPHYLYVDPDYVLPFMNPTKEEHETYVDAHRLTGVTMRAEKRMQINLHVQPDDYFTELRKIHEVYYPVVWQNESYEIDEDDADKFKSKVVTPVMITSIVQWTVLGLGIIILVVVLIVVLVRAKKKLKRYETLECEESEPEAEPEADDRVNSQEESDDRPTDTLDQRHDTQALKQEQTQIN
ncbi:lysosome membrane protein 2-like isoform X2 [Ptychodera flava]